MTANSSIDLSGFLDEHLSQASPDFLREMFKTFAEALMSADADARCGADYNQRSEARTISRSGYRERQWDTRAGSIEGGDPETAPGQLLPGLAAGTPPPLARWHWSPRGDQLPAGGVHPAHGTAGGHLGDHRAVEVADVGDGH